MIGNKFNNNILDSAKLFAMLNYGIANGGFVAYKTKYAVSITIQWIILYIKQSPRDQPVQHLASRYRNSFQPDLPRRWHKTLRSYVDSTDRHANASGLRLRACYVQWRCCWNFKAVLSLAPGWLKQFSRKASRYLGTDKLDPPVTISSNVTIDNIGVITRTYTSLDQAARECGDARVFAGFHFNFSSNEGIKAGYVPVQPIVKILTRVCVAYRDATAEKVFDNFERGWRQL